MRAERVGRETLLAQIVKMVGEVQQPARRFSVSPIAFRRISCLASLSAPLPRS
jgi:hypothetical protein